MRTIKESVALLTPVEKYGIGVIVVMLVLWAFSCAHDRDQRREGELVAQHQQISNDSAVRVVETNRTDSIGKTLVHRIDTVRQTIVRYRAVSDSSRGVVERIVQSTVHDTIKVRELVEVAFGLRHAGDSLATKCTEIANTCEAFRSQAANEREAWRRERIDLAKALKISESMHRHWGLGATVGVSMIRSSDGRILAGPGITLGVTYRW